MHCYCSICRKTAGGGGFAINLGAENNSLQVEGKEHIKVFSATIPNHKTGVMEQSPGERNFCGNCGSALWVWDPRWPELIHPFASAIDTELPTPPERYHIFQNSKPDWVPVPISEQDKLFETYPAGISLAAWHESHGLEQDQD